jgi:hypothetical protein
MNGSIKEIFEEVYNSNAWHGDESLSGPGSSLNSTIEIRKALPSIITKYNIRTFVDAPCGDFFWMNSIKMDLASLLDKYIGLDVAQNVIERNNEKYGDDKFEFRFMDMTSQVLPQSDLIMTRDCFHHLSYQNIVKALSNIKHAGSRYILLSTYTDSIPNKNSKLGVYINGRHLNFELPPFNFPKPLQYIDEKTVEPCGWTDKKLGLWAVASINIPELSEEELNNFVESDTPQYSLLRRIFNQIFRL